MSLGLIGIGPRSAKLPTSISVPLHAEQLQARRRTRSACRRRRRRAADRMRHLARVGERREAELGGERAAAGVALDDGRAAAGGVDRGRRADADRAEAEHEPVHPRRHVRRPERLAQRAQHARERLGEDGALGRRLLRHLVHARARAQFHQRREAAGQPVAGHREPVAGAVEAAVGARAALAVAARHARRDEHAVAERRLGAVGRDEPVVVRQPHQPAYHLVAEQLRRRDGDAPGVDVVVGPADAGRLDLQQRAVVGTARSAARTEPGPVQLDDAHGRARARARCGPGALIDDTVNRTSYEAAAAAMHPPSRGRRIPRRTKATHGQRTPARCANATGVGARTDR